jgi:hypothetical protein
MGRIGQISICDIGGSVGITDISSAMNHILCDYEVTARTCLRYPTPVSLNVTGYNPSALVNEVYREGRALEPDVIGILTSEPLSRSRAFICNDERIICVSDHGLRTPPNVTERFVILLLSAIRLERGITELEHASEGCVFNAGQSRTSVSMDVCHQCQYILEKDLPRVRSWLQRAEQVFRGNEPHVILLHGISTFAPWYEKVTLTLDIKGIDSKRVSYGYVGLLKFLRNTIHGQGAIDGFYNAYRRSREDYPMSDISVIAHSFGSLVVAQALEQYSDMGLKILLLVEE